MVTVDDVRAVLAGLPRSTEVLVRDRVKFRVGQIVYVAFSQDETEIGFAENDKHQITESRCLQWLADGMRDTSGIAKRSFAYAIRE